MQNAECKILGQKDYFLLLAISYLYISSLREPLGSWQSPAFDFNNNNNGDRHGLYQASR